MRTDRAEAKIEERAHRLCSDASAPSIRPEEVTDLVLLVECSTREELTAADHAAPRTIDDRKFKVRARMRLGIAAGPFKKLKSVCLAEWAPPEISRYARI